MTVLYRDSDSHKPRFASVDIVSHSHSLLIGVPSWSLIRHLYTPKDVKDG